MTVTEELPYGRLAHNLIAATEEELLRRHPNLEHQELILRGLRPLGNDTRNGLEAADSYSWLCARSFGIGLSGVCVHNVPLPTRINVPNQISVWGRPIIPWDFWRHPSALSR